MLKKLFAGAITSSFILSNSVMAQEDDHHHFDVDLVITNDQIALENDADIHGVTGYKIVEAEFHDGETETDDPGFFAGEGVFNPLEPVSYNALGNLQHFDGSRWVSEDEFFSEILTLTNHENTSRTSFFFNGFFGDASGVISEADEHGELHAHLEFELSDTFGDGTVDTGIYMVAISVSREDDNNATSAPFYIAFNFGLSEDDFEEAIKAIAEESDHDDH